MDLEDLEHFDRYVTKPLSGTDEGGIAKATQLLQVRLVLDLFIICLICFFLSMSSKR
jgi:hypothetical protein